jgi:hypothetical protein
MEHMRTIETNNITIRVKYTVVLYTRCITEKLPMMFGDIMKKSIIMMNNLKSHSGMTHTRDFWKSTLGPNWENDSLIT